MSSPAVPARFCPECGQPRSEDVCPQHGIPTIVQQTDDFTAQLIGTVIAGRYKVGVKQLMAWNGIDTRRPLIRPGQSLIVYVDAGLAAGPGAI